MARSDSKSFLGTGFRFPVQVDPLTGRAKTSSDEEDIKESIRIILGTRPGERPMLPKFGCAIHNYVFGTTDYTSLMLMKREVENSLVMWEPRIRDIDVEIVSSPDDSGVLLIEINYVVRSSNNPFNLVYPFYITEGYQDSAKQV